jgi:hypothetical protein
VASLALTPVNDALGGWLGRLRSAVSTHPPRRLPFGDKRLWFALIAAITALPFWWSRIRHLRWGDAYFIAQALSIQA